MKTNKTDAVISEKQGGVEGGKGGLCPPVGPRLTLKIRL